MGQKVRTVCRLERSEKKLILFDRERAHTICRNEANIQSRGSKRDKVSLNATNRKT